jgi:PmbA protein
MSSALSLIDDPTDSRALSADRYDDEGLASRRNELVRDGVLLGFVYDSTSASRAGVQSTASGVRAGYASGPVAACRALLLSGRETSTFEDVVTRVHDGLYVQSVTGVHSGVNPISGDFSVGIEGIIIRDGALAEPVREATIASTLQKMLLSIAHVADDVQWLPGNAAGQTIAISGMMLSGN